MGTRRGEMDRDRAKQIADKYTAPTETREIVPVVEWSPPEPQRDLAPEFLSETAEMTDAVFAAVIIARQFEFPPSTTDFTCRGCGRGVRMREIMEREADFRNITLAGGRGSLTLAPWCRECAPAARSSTWITAPPILPSPPPSWGRVKEGASGSWDQPAQAKSEPAAAPKRRDMKNPTPDLGTALLVTGAIMVLVGWIFSHVK